MATIHKPSNAPLASDGQLVVPGRLVPSFRVIQATERGVEHNILIRAHGGLGDIICSEPAIRYALENFKGETFSLATLYPELFQHLTFAQVYDLNVKKDLDASKFLIYDTVDTSNDLAAEFVCHTLMSAVDYASLYMWRLTLPFKSRSIKLVPNPAQQAVAESVSLPDRDILIHPGKTWKSRTFPKKFWDTVVSVVLQLGGRPVIIGGDIDSGRAVTIPIDVPDGCLDLRFKLTLMETVALMNRTRVLLTNDSAPIHMAASNDTTWIGFVSTVRHPDYLMHSRNGKVGHRMQDHGRGGMYQDIDVCPNKSKSIKVDDADVLDVLKWIPDPVEYAKWAIQRLNDPQD